MVEGPASFGGASSAEDLGLFALGLLRNHSRVPNRRHHHKLHLLLAEQGAQEKAEPEVAGDSDSRGNLEECCNGR